jgi:hypothetical protein
MVTEKDLYQGIKIWCNNGEQIKEKSLINLYSYDMKNETLILVYDGNKYPGYSSEYILKLLNAKTWSIFKGSFNNKYELW